MCVKRMVGDGESDEWFDNGSTVAMIALQWAPDAAAAAAAEISTRPIDLLQLTLKLMKSPDLPSLYRPRSSPPPPPHHPFVLLRSLSDRLNWAFSTLRPIR